ncbi:hypothetical protein OPU71_03585 [Niveibacterium sp. 24ML]|uniref:hypothetical protein n=1 Tax=Niveibacterium sp. 24ML TaxID=2985512 RepID=UPI0022717624|nr:hypothetical protein [Niveibacterium sp. 24ML]MCX9155200.1 hypothetical protein [Niveibacterium sp. 24ML]
MQTLVQAMHINQFAEAARTAGIRISPADASGDIAVHSPEGLTVIAGDQAAAVHGQARSIWGTAGVVSYQTALLYCGLHYLAQESA